MSSLTDYIVVSFVPLLVASEIEQNREPNLGYLMMRKKKNNNNLNKAQHRRC